MTQSLQPTGPIDPIAETEKSNLLLQAQLLRAQGQSDEAAALFARAAEIEERLARTCVERRERARAHAHQFSALSCWAQAGNWHLAISLGEELLAEPDLVDPLRARVHEYTQLLRKRRAEWSAGLVLASASAS